MSSALSDHLRESRAFAVWFRDLRVWSVAGFRRIQWQWPEEYIRPLASALTRRTDEVDRGRFEEFQLITIHFDGSLEARSGKLSDQFKGRLFFAKPGDVVYSKIDVRNGAIAIVPQHMSNAVVTSEFPVYCVRQNVAVPEYIKLLFKTSYFRHAINGMISGASGRKRVQPNQLEDLLIPLPPLITQIAIVARWQKAKNQIDYALQRIAKLESNLQREIWDVLGITQRKALPLPKAFAMHWKEMPRWSVEFLARQVTGQSGIDTGKYPAVRLDSICTGISGGTPSTKNSYYWNGDIPWVSPKDMKPAILLDSQDHITQRAVEDAVPLVPEDSVLIVVRSGILQRIVPIAVNKVAVSINQDIRAYVPKDNKVLADFLSAYLSSRQDAMLRLVKWSTTVQSINKETLDAFPVPLPPKDKQVELVKLAGVRRKQIERERERSRDLERLVASEIEDVILGTKRLNQSGDSADGRGETQSSI